MEEEVKKIATILFGFLIVAGIANVAHAEIRIGYVNSDRILSEYDDAKEAQSKLDVEARKLENEYRELLTQLDSLSQEFDRQKMIMSESRRQEKEQEIANLQTTIQGFQVNKMGPEGEIYQKQAELVGPVLEKIKRVIAKVGKDNKYDYILDTVAGNVLYADPAHDLTDKVIYELQRTE